LVQLASGNREIHLNNKQQDGEHASQHRPKRHHRSAENLMSIIDDIRNENDIMLKKKKH
jgi:hypothetical protein